MNPGAFPFVPWSRRGKEGIVRGEGTPCFYRIRSSGQDISGVPYPGTGTGCGRVT